MCIRQPVLLFPAHFQRPAKQWNKYQIVLEKCVHLQWKLHALPPSPISCTTVESRMSALYLISAYGMFKSLHTLQSWSGRCTFIMNSKKNKKQGDFVNGFVNK